MNMLETWKKQTGTPQQRNRRFKENQIEILELKNAVTDTKLRDRQTWGQNEGDTERISD